MRNGEKVDKESKVSETGEKMGQRKRSKEKSTTGKLTELKKDKY